MNSAVYTHGLSVRLLLLGDADHAVKLRKLDWSPRHRGWVRSSPRGGLRWQLRSSAWLTGRRASRSSGLGRRNKRWGTAIASLNLQQADDGWAVDIETVRRSDIDTLMGTVLGLDPEQWRIAYFRRLERFVCLTARDAHRLAVAVGVREEPVRGSTDGDEKTYRKSYLVRPGELNVATRIRTRASAEVEVVLYQVADGATAGTWKLEARLHRKTKQLPFGEADGERALDEVLARLVAEHGLEPVAKPARWEPRSSADRSRSAGDIAGLPMACWRGAEPAAGKFDTPHLVDDPLDDLCLVRSNPQPLQGLHALAGGAKEGAPTGGGGISSHSSCYDSRSGGNDGGSPGTRSRGTRATSTSSSSWSPLQQLLARRGTLVEVVHAKDDDPVFVAQQVKSKMGSFASCSASVLTASTRAADIRSNIHFGQWLGDHPLHPDLVAVADEDCAAFPDLTAHVWFILVDETVLCSPRAPVPVGDDGEVDHEAEARFIEGLTFEPDFTPLARRMESRLARFFRPLRVLCERTGLRVVLLSPEARPVGSSEASDRNLRSLSGDAGRYYAHLRLYQPRGEAIVEVWKDEVEGLGPGWLSPGQKRGGELPAVGALVGQVEQLEVEPDAPLLEVA